MKTRMMVAILTVAALVISVLVGFSPERKPEVTSQALPCAEMGDKLVCFDGGPVGELRCEGTDAATILCTRS